MKGHDCDVPRISEHDLGDIWSCIVCFREWQLRALKHLAEEHPIAYKKTLERLQKMGHDNPVVWSTRKMKNGKRIINA